MDPQQMQQLREATAAWTAALLPAAAADPDRRPVLDIEPSTGVLHVQAAVSPDCSYRLVKAALDAAADEVCFYIYNIGADYLLDLFRAAKARGVRVRMMYDANDAGAEERAALQTLGVELQAAPSTGARRVFTVCHQKYAVVDGQILLLGSANWVSSGIPKLTEPGTFRKANREWVVRIHDAPLATWFRGLFEADWAIPELPGLAAGPPPAPLPAGTFVPALAATPEEVFDIDRVELTQPVTVTPIVSPDNYFDLVRQAIAEATESIDIEQQYILAGGPKTEGLLAALAARKDALQIRIIVSPAFRKVGKKDNWELTVESLAAFGLDGSLRAMNLDVFVHLHNKGVIIDRRRVVVSSTNWSENSLARAREAGVLIDSPDVAEYYARVFDFDWGIAWDPANVPANLTQLFLAAAFVPGGFTEIPPADLL